MFKNKLAANLWRELMDSAKAAEIIPPCQNTDPEIWFPENKVQDQYANQSLYTVARQFCKACPVRDLCAQFAIVNQEEYGMWGGLTPRERHLIRGRNLDSIPKPGRPRKQA